MEVLPEEECKATSKSLSRALLMMEMACLSLPTRTFSCFVDNSLPAFLDIEDNAASSHHTSTVYVSTPQGGHMHVIDKRVLHVWPYISDSPGAISGLDEGSSERLHLHLMVLCCKLLEWEE